MWQQEDDFPLEVTVLQVLSGALVPACRWNPTERELQITLMLAQVGFP